MQYYYNKNMMVNDAINDIVPPAIAKRTELFDRSGRIIINDNVLTLTPLPTTTTDKTFEQLCDERAVQIKTIAKKRPVYYLFLRPGVDNAVVLLALKKHIENLVVLVDDRCIDSTDEWFVTNVLSCNNVVSITSVGGAERKAQLAELHTTGVVVTPALGSMILGPSKQEYRAAGITDSIEPNDIFERLLEGKSDIQRSYAMRLVEMCPQKIVAAKDFVWWFMFVFRYQIEQLAYPLLMANVVPEKDVFAFFDTEGFNQFAIGLSSEDRSPGNSLAQNKLQGLNYIAQNSSLEDFLVCKENNELERVPVQPSEYTGFFKWLNVDWNRGY
jgi:hypothetical protein